MIPVIHKELPNGSTINYAWFSVMHSRMDLLFCNQSSEQAENLASLILMETQRLETLFNRFDSQSELSAINSAAIDFPVSISQDMFNILELARQWHQKTNGLFDIAIQSDKTLTNRMACWELDQKQRTITRLHCGLILDLGGLAKGYALDACKKLLDIEGVEDALLNFGNSSIMARGNHPNGLGWPVGMGETQQGDALYTYNLHNQCLTTSGNNTMGRQHIIHPKTFNYIPGKHRVSVVTVTATEGEALSTALFAASHHEKASLNQLPECLYMEEFN